MPQKLGYVALGSGPRLRRGYPVLYAVARLSIDRGHRPWGRKRWVRVRPSGSTGTELLLAIAKAVSPEQASRIGNQTGGRVFPFLHTDDFWRDYRAMRSAG